jgi:multidrug efflux pump subunit AcrA (membrane-fusion protein)
VVVTTGTMRDGWVEVVAGLAVGDVIVVRGHARLVDGSRVEVRTQSGEAAVASAPRGERKSE